MLMKRMLDEIILDDWAANFRALESVRRLAIHHSDCLQNILCLLLLLLNQLTVFRPSIINSICVLAASLRSAVAKSGLFCFTDLFHFLSNEMAFSLGWLLNIA